MLSMMLLLATTAWAGGEKPMWGGIGHMTQGFMMGDVTGIGDALDNAADGGAPGAAMLLGGGGRMLLGGLVVVGGGGHGRFGVPNEGVDYSIMTYGGGGQFDVGVLIYNQQRSWVYPMVGVAFGGTDVVVANHRNGPMSVGNVTMGSGDRLELSGGYTAIEVGAGVTRLFFGPETQGGMVLDLQMAAWIPVSTGEYSAGAVSGAPGGLLFRINAGGGGFAYK